MGGGGDGGRGSLIWLIIIESVDFISRDGPDTPIMSSI